MNAKQALSKLRKLLGPKWYYTVDDRAPDAEVRAAAVASLPELTAAREAAKTRMDERRRELLSDPAYQALVQDWQAAGRACSDASMTGLRYRIKAGTRSELFFYVKAEGDNWADVIRKLEQQA